ncbi:MAG: HEPN domain-containing protein [Deltaproteobacteria bacterium]|nr:HEPN domain-containing protein [Deltaproteobacteria bacterium]MBI2975123.1 HEPN domain-containing protein [Deltaproteobacteria bacterium]
MNKNIQDLITKSKRSLAVAERLFSDTDYDFASSRAYYAMFYAAEALFLSKDLSFSSHNAVISALHEHFVKTGLLQKEFHKMFSDAFKRRQEGDYMSPSTITNESAKKLLDDAKIFIEKMIELIK